MVFTLSDSVDKNQLNYNTKLTFFATSFRLRIRWYRLYTQYLPYRPNSLIPSYAQSVSGLLSTLYFMDLIKLLTFLSKHIYLCGCSMADQPRFKVFDQHGPVQLIPLVGLLI